jgi:hypothetical protein
MEYGSRLEALSKRVDHALEPVRRREQQKSARKKEKARQAEEEQETYERQKK